MKVSSKADRRISQKLHSKKIADRVIFFIETKGTGICYLFCIKKRKESKRPELAEAILALVNITTRPQFKKIGDYPSTNISIIVTSLTFVSAVYTILTSPISSSSRNEHVLSGAFIVFCWKRFWSKPLLIETLNQHCYCCL